MRGWSRKNVACSGSSSFDSNRREGRRKESRGNTSAPDPPQAMALGCGKKLLIRFCQHCFLGSPYSQQEFGWVLWWLACCPVLFYSDLSFIYVCSVEWEFVVVFLTTGHLLALLWVRQPPSLGEAVSLSFRWGALGRACDRMLACETAASLRPQGLTQNRHTTSSGPGPHCLFLERLTDSLALLLPTGKAETGKGWAVGILKPAQGEKSQEPRGTPEIKERDRPAATFGPLVKPHLKPALLPNMELFSYVSLVVSLCLNQFEWSAVSEILHLKWNGKKRSARGPSFQHLHDKVMEG